MSCSNKSKPTHNNPPIWGSMRLLVSYMIYNFIGSKSKPISTLFEGYPSSKVQFTGHCTVAGGLARMHLLITLEHLQGCSVCHPCTNVFHIQVLVIYFFATPPIKPKQISGGLLIANHMDQSLRWPNQKH
jgi:hypothetical protein